MREEKYESSPDEMADERGTQEKEVEFEPSRELKDTDDPDEIAIWLEEEVEKYIEGHGDYMMGSHFQEIVQNLATYFAKRSGLSMDSAAITVKDKIEENPDESEDERNRGAIHFMGIEILKYSTGSDGFGAQVEEWNRENLKEALTGLIG